MNDRYHSLTRKRSRRVGGGGRSANAISDTVPEAIERPKVVRGAIEAATGV